MHTITSQRATKASKIVAVYCPRRNATTLNRVKLTSKYTACKLCKTKVAIWKVEIP